MIDQFFDKFVNTSMSFGPRKSSKEMPLVNYTPSIDIPYTRIIEHKHFEFGTQAKAVITREDISWLEKEMNTLSNQRCQKTIQFMSSI